MTSCWRRRSAGLAEVRAWLPPRRRSQPGGPQSQLRKPPTPSRPWGLPRSVAVWRPPWGRGFSLLPPFPALEWHPRPPGSVLPGSGLPHAAVGVCPPRAQGGHRPSAAPARRGRWQPLPGANPGLREAAQQAPPPPHPAPPCASAGPVGRGAAGRTDRASRG